MLSENTVVELKREYTPDITKTVVAFANTSGGTIYIGIADDGSVVGVERLAFFFPLSIYDIYETDKFESSASFA